MLSVIPKIALWPVPKAPTGAVKVLEEVGNWTSLIGAAPQFLASDNLLPLPGLPLNIYDSKLNKLPVGAYDTVTYPATTSLGRSFISITAVAGKAWLSQDKGITWTQKAPAGTYAVGTMFRFKNLMMYSNTGFAWEARALAQNFNGTPTAMSTGSVTGSPQVTAFGAKNANCIVTSGNHTSTAPIMYVCWNFPTFVAYSMDAEQANAYHYLGNNIFYTTKGANTRFFYVPPTQGTPELLRTKNSSIVDRVVHVRDQVIFTKSSGEVKTAQLAAVVENPAISMTDALTYLIKVLAVIEGANTSQLLESGSLSAFFRWSFDRLVVLTRRGTPLVSTSHIWEVKSSKPSVKFTFKAGTTGNAAQGSIGFSVYNGQYGYGTAHGQMLSSPDDPSVSVVICSDWRNAGDLYPYGGFGLQLTMNQATFRAKFVAVKVNNRTFSIDSLELAECRPYPYEGGVGTLCNWMLDMAEFVSGQTYTVELIPR